MKVVVFGSGGNLGQDLVAAFRIAGHEVVALDRGELDVLDLMAGKTYNFKVTADINTANVTGELISGSIIRTVLDDYSDDAGDVAVMKYAGTNTAVAAAEHDGRRPGGDRRPGTWLLRRPGQRP